MAKKVERLLRRFPFDDAFCRKVLEFKQLAIYRQFLTPVGKVTVLSEAENSKKPQQSRNQHLVRWRRWSQEHGKIDWEIGSLSLLPNLTLIG